MFYDPGPLGHMMDCPCAWAILVVFEVTLGYHISPTLSRNCLVYRFLLKVVILDWCLQVTLNALGMVWGCDPGPGLTRTMALGRGLCFLTRPIGLYDGLPMCMGYFSGV